MSKREPSKPKTENVKLPQVDGLEIEELPAADLEACAGGMDGHTCVEKQGCPGTQPVCSQQGP